MSATAAKPPALLLVGHGSREATGNDEFRQFVADFRAEQDWPVVEEAFIEFADPLVPEGLDRAAARSDEVVILPLILNAAGHVKAEIPALVVEARERHPNVHFRIARHLGAGQTAVDLLRERLKGAMTALDRPDPANTGLVLLGRGSSDPAANAEVAKLGRLLYEASDHDEVALAFTGVTHPRLEGVVQRLDRLGMRQIVILPHYLFTGTLMERIERQMEHLRGQYPGIRFALGDYYGNSPTVRRWAAERAAEALSEAAVMLECDACPSRTAAAHLHPH